MAFEGFDLGLKDKYNNCLCVGDYINPNFFIERKGQIIYSPKLFSFVVQWDSGNIKPLHEFTKNFWKGVEKCQ